MSVTTTPHLNFRGDARSALEHYHSVFGGDLMITTYQDMGNVQDPADANQVVYGQVATAAGFQIMAFDMPSARPWDQGVDSFYVSVRGTDVEEITGYWEKLAAGATVVQLFGPSQWAAVYGMVKDRFGVTWVLDVMKAY